jgi:hypothetical protein
MKLIYREFFIMPEHLYIPSLENVIAEITGKFVALLSLTTEAEETV